MLLKISRDLLPKFKCFCSSPELIMMFVYMKCRFTLSYRDLEEMMQIRGAVIEALSHLLVVSIIFKRMSKF
jgi:putative transposase